MTCIVGLVEDGKVVIGGDSAGVDGSYNLQVRSDAKVFRNGPMLIGFSSSFRMGQLLRYAFQPPERIYGTDVYAYMVTTFVDAVRTCLKQGGYARSDTGEESGGDFLVGYAGRLFRICSDYQVAEVMTGFDAVVVVLQSRSERYMPRWASQQRSALCSRWLLLAASALAYVLPTSLKHWRANDG